MSQTIPLPLDGTTVPIFPSGASEPITVYNDGNFVAYIDSDTNVQQGGYGLSPGSTIVWDQGRKLYAGCRQGESALLVLTPNGGQVFDASAVASQLIGQGLAQAIADAIQLRGAPPYDPLDLISNTNAGAIPGGGTVIPAFDVSGYQSVSVHVSEEETATFAAPLPRRITLDWLTAAPLSFPVARDIFYVTGTNNLALGVFAYFASYDVQVKGSQLRITIEGTARTTTSVDVSVTGSYKTAPPNGRWRMESAYWQLAAPWVGIGDPGYSVGQRFARISALAVPVGNHKLYPPMIGGEMEMSVRCIAPAGCTVDIGLTDSAFTTTYFRDVFGAMPGIAQSSEHDIILGNDPPIIDLNVAGNPTSTLQIALRYAL